MRTVSTRVSARPVSGTALAATVAALATALGGCAGGAGAGRVAPASSAPSAFWTPPQGAGRTPVGGASLDARTVASQNGLAFVDSGDGVLLQSADLRARFWSGSDRMTLDGKSMPMGEAARREQGVLLVPAAGAREVERAVADARARRVRSAETRLALARATLPPPTVPARASTPVAPPAVAGVRGPAGDPSWVASAPERAWKWIVIHHSDDTSGCAAKYDRVHLEKGWEHGLGYHFVIGNGTQTGDGEVEVGGRWRSQLHGAHAKTDDNRYNDFGVGIVLVGDFTQGPPTSRQYAACVRLTRWLMARYGVTADRVLRHSDCKATCCPGPAFPWERFLADVTDA